MTIADLKVGQNALIVHLQSSFDQKLLEMGCVPGNQVQVQYIGIGGSPIGIRLCETLLALRKTEAAQIEVILK